MSSSIVHKIGKAASALGLLVVVPALTFTLLAPRAWSSITTRSDSVAAVAPAPAAAPESAAEPLEAFEETARRTPVPAAARRDVVNLTATIALLRITDRGTTGLTHSLIQQSIRVAQQELRLVNQAINRIQRGQVANPNAFVHRLNNYLSQVNRQFALQLVQEVQTGHVSPFSFSSSF
jgi:hypothetical protein